MTDEPCQAERRRSRRIVQIVFATTAAGSAVLAVFANRLAPAFDVPDQFATAIANCFLIMGLVSAAMMFVFDRAFNCSR